jgi:hypothetical protein
MGYTSIPILSLQYILTMRSFEKGRVMRVRRVVLMLSLGAILLLVAVPHAASDGGFFWPSEFAVYQNAERVIFTVNGDGTITIVLGISYEGEAEEFSWVFPVPSLPELDVAETESLKILEAATELRMTYPPCYCEHLRMTGGGGGGGGPDIMSAGEVGPYDYIVLGGEGDPDALVTWLRENGYGVPEEIEPVIAAYVEEGMYFLAMRLRQDFSTQDIQPIVITYEANRVIFPMRLTAVAAVEDMPIKIWIFADEQYEPRNYAHPSPDFSRFRAASRVANVGSRHSPNNATAYGYFDELKRYQALHDGRVFFTRLAGPSATLLLDGRYYWSMGIPTGQAVGEDDFLLDLIMRFPYLTFLWTRMSPDQMTVDPVFVASSQAEDVSHVVDLRDVIEPLEYWGCSSARALSDEQWASLPEEHTYFADLRLDIVHPAAWVLSTIETNPETGLSPAYVYAPEVVDRDTLDAFFAGETTPPMFVVAEGLYHAHEMSNLWWVKQDEFKRLFDLPHPEDILSPEEGQVPVYVRYYPKEPGSDHAWSSEVPAVFLSMLASEEDWEADGPLYETMLAYGQAFQFYRAPELRHTLFLDGYGLSVYTASVQVPYPEGWEVLSAHKRKGEILIRPQGFISELYGPYARLIPLRQVVAPIVFDEGGDVLSVVLDWLWEAYSLPDDERESEWRHAIQCEGQALPFGSENPGGTSGWVKVTGGYVIEYSAPARWIEEYGDVLQLMAESTPSGILCE